MTTIHLSEFKRFSNRKSGSHAGVHSIRFEGIEVIPWVVAFDDGTSATSMKLFSCYRLHIVSEIWDGPIAFAS